MFDIHAALLLSNNKMSETLSCSTVQISVLNRLNKREQRRFREMLFGYAATPKYGVLYIRKKTLTFQLLIGP